MKDQLTQYFESFAENAIQRMKAAILAISFYERIQILKRFRLCATPNWQRLG